MGLALGFVNSILLTRTLGVTGRGEFALFSASFGLLSLLLGLGFDTSLRYHIATGTVAKDRVLASLLLFSAIGAAVALGAARLNHALFSNELFLPASKQSLPFELLLAGVVLSTLLYSGISALFAGYQRFAVLNVASAAFSALSVLVFGVLFRLKQGDSTGIGSDHVFVAFLGLQIFNALVLGAMACRTFGISWSWSLLERTTFASMFRYAALTYVANLAQFLNYRVDTWVVQYFEGPRELGLYSLSANLAMMFSILPRSISTVLLPAMAAQSSDVSLAQACRVARLVMAINVLVAVPAALLAGWWLPLLYGAGFGGATRPFAILLLGCAPFALCVVLAGVLAGMNRADVNLRASLLGLIATVVLDLALIPRYGIEGAAVASATSYLVTTTFVAISFAQIAGLPLWATLLPVPQDFRYLINGVKSLLR